MGDIGNLTALAWAKAKASKTLPYDPQPLPDPNLIRRFRKRWQLMFRDLRGAGWRLGEKMPEPMRRRLAKPVAYADMLLVDHGVFRLGYLNRHALGGEAYRSAQPAPHDIARFARQGIRTIINLRGPRDCGAYRLERQACAKLGITLVDFTLGSRAAPPKAMLHAASELFDSISYPMLMHCKSGADRAGLMSVLYQHFKLGRPMTEAVRQLALRFGHIRAGHTGILDAFFAQYIAFNAKTPIAFLDWVDRHYDPVALKRDFRPTGLGTLLVDGVLRRE